jgi:hypothetical protein
MTDVAGYTYGLVVFAGGAIGFLKGKKDNNYQTILLYVFVIIYLQ